MKTILLILLSVFGIAFSYSQNEKKVLTDFANALINDNIGLKKIIDTYINYDQRAKEITLQQLQLYRDGLQSNYEGTIVYSYEEAIAKGKGYEIKSKRGNIFFIYFNEKINMPILLNADSKIISICAIDKGGRRFFLTTGGE